MYLNNCNREREIGNTVKCDVGQFVKLPLGDVHSQLKLEELVDLINRSSVADKEPRGTSREFVKHLSVEK